MSRAYSIDLRQRVVGYVEGDGSKTEAARVFTVGRDTVYRWLRQKKNTGELAAKQRKPNPYKIENERLLSEIQSRPDSTLAELSQVLGVTAMGVLKACRRLKITRKKNHTVS